MNENEILAEIRAVRDEHARACDYDIHKIFADLRAETARLEAEGWKVVSPPPRRPNPALYAVEESENESCTLREEPPKG